MSDRTRPHYVYVAYIVNGEVVCDCTNRSLAEPEPDLDWEPLALEPCALCGEVAACAYDAEGRAMIHTDSVEDDER